MNNIILLLEKLNDPWVIPVIIFIMLFGFLSKVIPVLEYIRKGKQQKKDDFDKANEECDKTDEKIQEYCKHLEECKNKNIQPTDFRIVQDLINQISSLASQILAGCININSHQTCRNIINQIMKNKYAEKDNMIYDFYKTYGLVNDYRPSSYNNIFKAYKKQFPFYVRVIGFFKPNLYTLKK